MITDRVRGQGKGVKSAEANVTKLKPLSKGYIKRREKDPRLHEETTPGTSNLTRQGDMLDALDFKVKADGLTIGIFDADELKKAIFTNKDRPWVNLSKGEQTKVRGFLEKLLRSAVK